MSNLPIVAIMYDFDRTLCTKDMQDYSFIPSLGMTESEFWQYSNSLGQREHMDSILAYMYAMVKISKDKNIPLLRRNLVDMGKNVELFKGVEGWFDRITEFGRLCGMQVEHYVISSGMKEIIEGTPISKCFKSIFACEFLYDENGNGVWPKTDVNYTNKTQFVYRINKGVLDVANDNDLNRSMPDDSKRVPFCNMIYIGDGLSDVPCMKMMKAYGGYSIAVYQNKDSKVEDLLKRGRVDYIYPADYSENTGLDITVKNIIRKMSISETLYDEYTMQKSLL
ncbi:HAD family hydrolase [Ruminococcus sp.]|uniref:HAD family hydrolase n=1 Tax=Ruminococcus sp. TaxID=41978 RepID=UPI0026055E29|nr:HAD family hydrolase [Ruminococcus sp.]MCI2112737.1 haloacid dehalogenase-like hydrolase [Ruminococcus sp.]MDD6989083.1 HAD family hydrolase [Ruminococcus sp.]MDY6200952.1 HAD family hydrolase [Ruminococcus sp.]